MFSRTPQTRTKIPAILAVLCVLMTALTMVVGPGVQTAEAQVVDVGGLPDPSACYGVADQAFADSGDGLSVIGRFDGATENIGADGTGTSDIEAVAFGPGTIIDPALGQQVLYTFEGVDFGYLNLTTGLFTSLAKTPPAGFETVDGMTWDPQLNVFWLTDRLGDNGVADRVAAYDPITGETTIGPFSTGIATEAGWTNDVGQFYDDFDDIALDPTDFRLYAILNKGGTGGGLVELSKVDGSVINYIGLFTPSNAATDFDGDGITDDIEGLAFFNDGLFYGSTGANGPGDDNNRFYAIDLTTGATTWIADFTGYGDYEALGCLTVEAFIDVEKGTAEPGGTPEDADVAPGPTITTPTVEWTYEITNESLSLGLQSVRLVDDQIDGVLFDQVTGETQCAEGVILAPGEVLAPQASVFCTVTGISVVGPYTNTATLTGQADPGNGLQMIDLIDQDPSNYQGAPVIPDPPVLAVVKTAVAGAGIDCAAVTPVVDVGDPVVVSDGDTVTFCVTVTNTGGSDATEVTVTDNNATPADAADDFVVPGLDNIDLAAGESATGSFEIVATTSTPVLNTVGATGTDPFTGDPTNEPTDPAEITVLGLPILEVVKTAVAGADVDCAAVTPVVGDDAVTVEIGDTVTFCITVTNVGESTATEVTVTDDNLTPNDPADDVVVIDNVTLAAGESVTGSFVVDGADAGVNTVTATGTDPNTGEPTNEPNDPSEVLVLGPPILEVVKTAVAGADVDCEAVTPAPLLDEIPTTVGADVTFCITVTNVGETAATEVTVTDDNFTPNDPADDVVVIDGITLAAGESATGSFTYTVVSQAPLQNTVTATGIDPNTGLPTNQPTDDAGILPPQGNAELAVVKTAAVGDDVDCSTVAPAQGADVQDVEIGDSVTFCVTVTNIGDGPASNVVVIDDNFTPGDTADDTPIVGLDGIDLAAGESASGSIVFAVTELEAMTNVVTATGTDVNANEPTNEPDDPSGVVPFGTPVLTIVKTATVGDDVDCATVDPAAGLDEVATNIGDVVTYCIIVTNTGNGPATDVKAIDDNFTPDNDADDVVVAEAATLAPGAILVGSFTSTVTSAVAQKNTAKATGTDPVTGEPTNEPVDPAGKITPAIDLVKQILRGADQPAAEAAEGINELVVGLAGDEVTWVYTVTNTGSMPLIVEEIVDPLLDVTLPIPEADQLIAPGASVTITANGVVTEAGEVSEASVQGQPADAAGLPVVGFAALTAANDAAEGPAAITLTKQILRGADRDCAEAIEGVNEMIVAEPGDAITWCFLIMNSGVSSLTNVLFTDQDLQQVEVDVLAETGSPALAPGETIRRSSNAIVGSGGTVNVASVQAVPSDPTGDTTAPAFAGAPTIEDTNEAENNSIEIKLEKRVLLGLNANCDDAVEGRDEGVTGRIGDDVTWCFTAINTGSVALRITEIVDETLDVVLPIPEDQQVLLVTDPMASVTVQLSGTIDAETTENTASVEGTAVDPETGEPIIDVETGEPVPPINDTNTAVESPTMSDLSLVKTKTVPASGVQVGAIIDYQVEIENKGPDTAVEVKMVDTLPAGLEYIEVPVVDGWTCSLNAENSELTCELESLEVGVVETIAYKVEVLNTAVRGVPLVNTATVGFPGVDPTPSDNTDTESIEIPVPRTIITPAPAPLPLVITNPPGITPPDEVLSLTVTPPLAITGSNTALLVSIANVALMMGGVFMIVARRRRDDEE